MRVSLRFKLLSSRSLNQRQAMVSQQASVAQKLSVLTYLDDGHTYREAAKKFHVPVEDHCAFRTKVKRWKRKRSELELLKNDPSVNSKKRQRCGGGGRKPAHAAAEKEAADWVRAERKKGHRVTMRQVTSKVAAAVNVPDDDRKEGDEDGQFLASERWKTAFKNRNKLSQRKKTASHGKTPANGPDLADSFRRRVLRLRARHNYPLSRILNTDHTPICIDGKRDKTLDTVGASVDCG